VNIKNASDFPKRFFGLHFIHGVCAYPSMKKNIYISPEVANDMDASFSGKPLFVRHVDDYDMETLQEDQDGIVIKSFYNPSDGFHWCEFMAMSQDALDKIAAGWKLSNSYKVKDPHGSGGTYQDVEYDIEVLKGEYHHMALIESPRYDRSIILTPEEFKAHNQALDEKRILLNNSKDTSQGDNSMSLFFKKTKVEKLDNAKDMESLSVILPKTKKEVTVLQLINEADEKEAKKDEKKYANEADFVKIDDESEMTLGELVAKLKELLAAAEGGEEGSDDEVVESEEVVDDVNNASDDKDEKPAPKKEEKKVDNAKEKGALKLKNASDKGLHGVEKAKPEKYQSMAAQIQLGRDRY